LAVFKTRSIGPWSQSFSLNLQLLHWRCSKLEVFFKGEFLLRKTQGCAANGYSEVLALNSGALGLN
jgi:hypothetical protein